VRVPSDNRHRQMRDNDPGLKTTQLPTRTTYSTGRSRSMSPALRAKRPQMRRPITDLLPGNVRRDPAFATFHSPQAEESSNTQRDKLTHEKTQRKYVSDRINWLLGGSNHRRRDRNITHEEARIRQEEQMLKEALRAESERTHTFF
jgi:hypothetical protein